MGCGGSKEEENPDAIKSEMKKTKIPEFDDLFDSASAVLGGLEELRAAFQDTRERMNEIGRVEELKEPHIKEAFRVFLWSVSAHKGGNINDAHLKFETDPIAFTVDCENMDHLTYEFADNAKQLIAGVTSGPGKVDDLVSQLEDLSEKAKEFKSTASDAAKSAGLNIMEAAAAAGNTITNLNTILNGLPKAKNVATQVKEGAQDLKALASTLYEMTKQADTVGKEASDKGHLKISEIFDNYHTAPKKTPQEIEAMKKGGDKKKGGKADKKKEGKSPTKKPEEEKKKPEEEKKQPEEEKKQPEEHKQEENHEEAKEPENN